MSIHPGLSVELLAKVLNADVSGFMSLPEAKGSGVEEIDGAAEVIDAFEFKNPAPLEGEFSFGEAVFALVRVEADLAGVIGDCVNFERVEIGIIEVMKPERILQNTDLSDLIDSGSEGFSEILCERHVGNRRLRFDRG